MLPRRGKWFLQRGWRGWADHDVWGLDAYLAAVMAGALRHLAAHHHGHPVDFLPDYETRWDFTEEESAAAAAAWTAWLRDKAAALDWYARDEDGISDDLGWISDDLSEEERVARIDAHQEKMRRFHEEIMPDLVRRWGALWD